MSAPEAAAGAPVEPALTSYAKSYPDQAGSCFSSGAVIHHLISGVIASRRGAFTRRLRNS